MNLFIEILKNFIAFVFFAGNVFRFIKDIDNNSHSCFVALDIMGAFIACFLKMI